LVSTCRQSNHSRRRQQHCLSHTNTFWRPTTSDLPAAVSCRQLYHRFSIWQITLAASTISGEGLAILLESTQALQVRRHSPSFLISGIYLQLLLISTTANRLPEQHQLVDRLSCPPWNTHRRDTRPSVTSLRIDGGLKALEQPQYRGGKSASRSERYDLAYSPLASFGAARSPLRNDQAQQTL